MRLGVPGGRPRPSAPSRSCPTASAGWPRRRHRGRRRIGRGGRGDVPDEAYAEGGASIATAADALGADVVCKVQRPSEDEVALLSEGAVLVGLLQPLTEPEFARPSPSGVTGFSLDAVPRITRSQSMDALSSQSTVAGYKAVLLVAASLGKFFPMLTTAAARSRLRGCSSSGRGRGPPRRSPPREARRRCLRIRRPPGRPRAGREPRRDVPRARDAGRGDRGRVRGGDSAKPSTGASRRLVAAASGRGGRRHHHRAHPRPAGAHPADARGGARECARLRGRRPRGRGGRELRGHPAGRDRRGRGRHGHRRAQPAERRCPSTRPRCTRGTWRGFLALLVKESALELDFEDEIVAGDVRLPRRSGRSSEPPEAVPAERDPGRQPDDLRAGRLPRLRADLARPDAAAHAAHVGHERDPRDRAHRRDADSPARRTRGLEQALAPSSQSSSGRSTSSAASSSPTGCSRCSSASAPQTTASAKRDDAPARALAERHQPDLRGRRDPPDRRDQAALASSDGALGEPGSPRSGWRSRSSSRFASPEIDCYWLIVAESRSGP